MNDPSRRDPLAALGRLLGSVEAVRNGQALFALLGTFSAAGLLLAMAGTSLARDQDLWAALQAGAALTVAFYGTNATGLLLMDQARGLPVRALGDAVRDALGSAHRLLLVLLAVGLIVALMVAAVSLGLYAARLPMVGPLLFAMVVPLGVVLLGVGSLAVTGVVAPLAAPAVWSGHSARSALRMLRGHVRERLLFAALLTAALGMLTAAVAALASFVVLTGGRAVAALAVLVTGIELPPQQLMAGLFGFGLRSLGAAGAPVAQTPHGAAALVGGGMVFVLALVLPALVYLRGVCALYLALEGGEREMDISMLQEAEASPAASGIDNPA